MITFVINRCQKRSLKNAKSTPMITMIIATTMSAAGNLITAFSSRNRRREPWDRFLIMARTVAYIWTDADAFRR